jgi:hypothetical protein
MPYGANRAGTTARTAGAYAPANSYGRMAGSYAGQFGAYRGAPMMGASRAMSAPAFHSGGAGLPSGGGFRASAGGGGFHSGGGGGFHGGGGHR